MDEEKVRVIDERAATVGTGGAGNPDEMSTSMDTNIPLAGIASVPVPAPIPLPVPCIDWALNRQPSLADERFIKSLLVLSDREQDSTLSTTLPMHGDSPLRELIVCADNSFVR